MQEGERVAKLIGVDGQMLYTNLLKPRIKVGNEFVNQGRNKDQVSIQGRNKYQVSIEGRNMDQVCVQGSGKDQRQVLLEPGKSCIYSYCVFTATRLRDQAQHAATRRLTSSGHGRALK